MNKINEIEARLQAATPGPWEKSMNKYSVWSNGINDLVCSQVSIRDANFIAHAPEDLRWALDEIKRLKEINKELRREMKHNQDALYHGCGYYSVCWEAGHSCPCASDAPVMQGYSKELWERMAADDGEN